MMMRHRRYSSLDRCIAKSVGYAINQKYRNKSRSNYAKTNTSADGSLGIGFWIFMIILLLSACSGMMK